VIKKGNFKRRSQVKLTETDLDEILKLEMGDANVGREKPISDEELDKVLDRQWLVENFDREMRNAASKREEADDAAAASSTAAAHDHDGGRDGGFELLDEINAEF
jgi:hypothetical protein